MGTQISIFDGSNKFVNDKPIRLIELFAGIGSQAKALTNLGVAFEHYRVCEFDKYAVMSYNAIHGTDFAPTDIRDLVSEDLGIHDTSNFTYLLTYSFPCQDLSNGGERKGMKKGEGTRSGLLWEVERLLKDCKELPQILLMENVPQIHGEKNKDDFQLWISFLQELGYKNFYQDLNSKDYGIPQSRNRCFMVSILGDFYFDFPKPIKLNYFSKDIIKLDCPAEYNLSEKGNDYFNRRIENFIDRRKSNNEYPYLVYNSHGLYKGEIKENEITNTVTAGQSEDWKCVIMVSKGKYRKKTPLEDFMLMGFSKEDYEKCVLAGVKNSQLYKQAGNSIVVNVLMHIFEALCL
jgi:DNA (cytosine-5)-methyltransferase 1